MRISRSLLRPAVVLVFGVLAAGCINFAGPSSTTQHASTGDVGSTLRYTFSICSDSLDDGTCNPHTGISSTRLIVGILVPTSATAPAVVTGTLSEPISVTRDGVSALRSDLRGFRTTQLGAEMNLQQPPPAGSTWVGYIGEDMYVGPGATPTGTVSIDVALPLDQAGNPSITSAMRQVSIQESGSGVVTGTDPAAGETDTLSFECYEDFDDNGVPEQAYCMDEFDPAAPQLVTLRRLALTGPSAINIDAGSTAPANLTLRLDGPALPAADVTLTSTVTGAGLTASVPATATTSVGTNVTIPVIVAATSTAASGSLTVRATTSNGTQRVAVVPINTVALPVAPVVTPPADATRPETTITARRLANGKLRLTGRATDAGVSDGLTTVKVQAVHGIGNDRCMAWTGRAVVRELCSKSLARWITITPPVAANTIELDWSATTPVAVPGLWLLRARSADGHGFVSRVANARVTVAGAVPAAQRASR